MTVLLPSALECLASLTGLLNLWLLAAGRQLNWLFGILTVTLYFFVFMQARLYGLMMLQVIFLGMQVYGLFQWQASQVARNGLISRSLPRRFQIALLPLTLCVSLVIFLILNYILESPQPAGDALITTLSLLAQWMMANRWREHWLLWMVVDSLLVMLCLAQALWPSSLFYGLCLLMCLHGLKKWDASPTKSI